jgi:hypothetical protein
LQNASNRHTGEGDCVAIVFAYSSYQFFDKRILEKNQQYVMGGKFHAFDGTFPLFRADINPVYGVTAGLNNRSEPY